MCHFGVPTAFCAPQILSPGLKSFGALCVAANGKDIDYTLANVKKLRHTNFTRSVTYSHVLFKFFAKMKCLEFS